MTGRVAIITDSSACIPAELVEKYGIELVPMNVILGDKTYRDGIDISPTEFYTLGYLVKGGHVRRAAALASSLLRIKPIFSLNEGDAHPVTNARTTLGAIKRIINIMGQKVVKGQPLHVAVMHADALDAAIVLRDRISSQFDCVELFITEFTPVMGAHIGPGLVGIAFYSGD